jgi:hypothetical protein
MTVDWNRPLTRVLILKTGERLRTLHDAAELITRRFGSVTNSALLEHAIVLEPIREEVEVCESVVIPCSLSESEGERCGSRSIGQRQIDGGCAIPAT